MRVCIFTAGEDQENAMMCLATIRHHEPLAQVVHLTDRKTERLPGVDAVWRRKWDGSMGTIMRLRMEHLASIDDDEPTVVLDSDLLVCSGLARAFGGEPFDVALTWRPGEELMPYNTGVMFARGAGFWRDVLAEMDADPRYGAFLTEQEAVAKVARSGRHKVRDLTCDEWNNSMVGPAVFPAKARIVHCKGKRKPWMRGHFDRGVWK